MNTEQRISTAAPLRGTETAFLTSLGTSGMIVLASSTLARRLEGEESMGDEESAEAPRTGREPRRVIAGGAIAVVVVALVAALATLLWLRPANGPQQLVSTAGWQTYSDPQHLFSIMVPSDWSIQQSQEPGGSFGDSTGSYSYTGEDIWFGVPPESIDGTGVSFDVMPLTTDFARHWACSDSGRFTPNRTLAAVPAYYDGLSMWTVDTHDAHFQINANYPGGPTSPHTSPPMMGPPPTVTPVPADQLAADKQVITTVLATFTLTNPTPLGC